MSSEAKISAPPAKKTGAKGIIIESLVVGAVGLVFALAANQISGGIKLGSDDYFPRLVGIPTNTIVIPPGSNAPTGVELLRQQLQAAGLQLALGNEVIQLYNDPRYAMELVVFVDAREDKSYAEGHIPGAYQFDHYRKENYLNPVVRACTNAEQVIVYCTGGECEDSQSAAIILIRDAGINPQKLFVYAGGINEWMSNALPLEVGVRKSGIYKTNAVNATTPGGAK